MDGGRAIIALHWPPAVVAERTVTDPNTREVPPAADRIRIAKKPEDWAELTKYVKHTNAEPNSHVLVGGFV